VLSFVLWVGLSIFIQKEKWQMPNDSQPSTPTHVTVPVSGIGNVAVPVGTPAKDLHSAVLAHPDYVAPDIQEPHSEDALSAGLPSNITADNALENRADFRKQASKAWGMVRMGFNPGQESGFTVDRDGRINPVTTGVEMDANNRSQAGGMKQKITPDTADTLHIHNRGMDPKPSQADIEVAKKIGIPVYVASTAGLFQISADGQVHQVYANPDWASEKQKK
jgi:hypothetical protein